MLLVQVQQFRTGTRYALKLLHGCGKKVKTRSQKVLGANSYIGRSYREKAGRGSCTFSVSIFLIEIQIALT